MTCKYHNVMSSLSHCLRVILLAINSLNFPWSEDMLGHVSSQSSRHCDSSNLLMHIFKSFFSSEKWTSTVCSLSHSHLPLFLIQELLSWICPPGLVRFPSDFHPSVFWCHSLTCFSLWIFHSTIGSQLTCSRFHQWLWQRLIQIIYWIFGLRNFQVPKYLFCPVLKNREVLLFLFPLRGSICSG